MNIEEFNRKKQVQLINNIMNCNGDYQLVCIDVDDVMYNTDAIMQEILATIDVRATKEYRGEISRETSEDSLAEIQKSFAILNAILEEYPYLEDLENGTTKVNDYPKIDYSKIYKPENLIPGSVEAVNQILAFLARIRARIRTGFRCDRSIRFIPWPVRNCRRLLA